VGCHPPAYEESAIRPAFGIDTQVPLNVCPQRK
jgi:hypothetical protein